MFGPHLILDGSGCNPAKLADRILVEQVLNEYPAAIGMTKIGGPYMFEYQAPDPAYSGVSGIVVIAESHIAIHTFPELDYFTLDIFSCKNFDHELAIAYIKGAFEVREMDRMLIQRGLSFRGPHHGKQGVPEDLISGATAHLEAGVTSKDTAVSDKFVGTSGTRALAATGREASRERREQSQEGQEPQGEETKEDRRDRERNRGEAAPDERLGRMLWPEYGVTPDYGTYGTADESVGDGARVKPLTPAGAVPVAVEGNKLSVIESVQVNPTASISGLLDKLSHAGGQARALGRGLASWERMVCDPQMTIALACSAGVVAEGLREALVYAAEHHYVDTVIVSAEEVFADLYESLGYAHYAEESQEVTSTGPHGLPGQISGASGDSGWPDPETAWVRAREGHETVLAFFRRFVLALEPEACANSSELWRQLGAKMSAQAPRKGLLQAAAAADVALFTPDLGTSTLGRALLDLPTRGPRFGLSEEVVELARVLGQRPRLGVIRVGVGAADALLRQARDVAKVLGVAAPTLSRSISIGMSSVLQQSEHHAAIAADADLVLPLLLTGLAQRLPRLRYHAGRESTIREEAPAVACGQ